MRLATSKGQLVAQRREALRATEAGNLPGLPAGDDVVDVYPSDPIRRVRLGTVATVFEQQLKLHLQKKWHAYGFNAPATTRIAPQQVAYDAALVLQQNLRERDCEIIATRTADQVIRLLREGDWTDDLSLLDVLRDEVECLVHNTLREREGFLRRLRRRMGAPQH